MSDGWEAAVSAPRDGRVFRIAEQYVTTRDGEPALAWRVELAKFFTRGRWFEEDGEREFCPPSFWGMRREGGKLVPRGNWGRDLRDGAIWAPYAPGQNMLDNLPA